MLDLHRLHIQDSIALFDLFSPLYGPNPLFPEATGRLSLLSTPTVTRLFEMGPPLQLLQDPIAKHQSLEEANRPFHPTIADNHL